jgi:hypothetical protein
MYPDCNDAGNLIAKLRHASELGVTRADFYHYGFMPLSMLDRLRSAMDEL